MSAPFAVEADHLVKRFGKTLAVDDVSFAVPQGTVLGLLGPNGAGKTSTIRMMIGITMPDSGEVRMFGEPFRRAHLDRIGYLPEERGLYRKMTVIEQLTLFGELHGLPRSEAARRAQQWCERLELKDWTLKRVDELSKGMQQKVQFIGALLHEPDFVIMDEPFYGLDPVNATLLKDVLLEQKKTGRTILFSTHRMDQVEKLCDSICLVNRGKSVLKGAVGEVKARYGKRTVQINYEGDASFLRSSALIEAFNDYGNYVETRLNPGADSQDLLREAMSRVRVNRFELMEPSLEEIFIETVGKTNA
jgi:ABC-2 type transport system ATP-binding protein